MRGTKPVADEVKTTKRPSALMVGESPATTNSVLRVSDAPGLFVHDRATVRRPVPETRRRLRPLRVVPEHGHTICCVRVRLGRGLAVFGVVTNSTVDDPWMFRASCRFTST